jgi:integrase
LHSYRYAWAQRAKTAGMPLREAMAHLGHGSKAIHQAYSEKAEIVTLPLEYYEKKRMENVIEFTRMAAA